MTRPASRFPTELELEILKVLWRNGPATVRHVREALAGRRDLAYTSVMTVMNIMVDKGYVSRRKKGGSYEYRPVLGRDTTVRGMLDDVVERAFEGSAAAAALHLLDSTAIDESELEALRDLLDRKREEKS